MRFAMPPRHRSTDAPGAPGMPAPGDVIAGKYLVEEVIGAGGMGCVLAARHALLRTRVAIKLLLPQMTGVAGATDRFLREARAAAALRGEHVARVLDMGTTDAGAPFLVMEYLTGRDLRTVIRERAPLPLGEAVGYLLETCEAILEAHSLGICHRDIKPANIFITSRPNGTPMVKVLDFGLAKVLPPDESGTPEESLTQTAEVIGSPPYMPPEQFRSLRNADARSDIWALGVVLYELLTGRRPFAGEGTPGIMASVMADTPARAWALRPELPVALDALIMRCLEKSPDRRPQQVADLISELAHFAPTSGRDVAGRDLLPAMEAESTTILVHRCSPPVVPGSPVAPATGVVPPTAPPLPASSAPRAPLASTGDVTDLSHAATARQQSPTRAPRHAAAITAAFAFALILAGAISLRMLDSEVSKAPPAERGGATGMSSASTAERFSVPPAAVADSELSTPVSGAQHATGGGPSAFVVPAGPSSAAEEPNAESAHAAPRAAGRGIPSASPTVAATPAAPSISGGAAAPPSSSSAKSPAAPQTQSDRDDDLLGKFN